MKVSWTWLNQIIDLQNIELHELTNKLTLAGFEIEEIYELPNLKDKIIDLSLTANRQDAAFLVGLAREISTLLDKPLKHQNKAINNYGKHIMHNNNSKILCESLNDLKINIITNIKNKPSPPWLQHYLSCYDIKTTHILHDIIEYIKIKWGQDIEIFDSNKIDLYPISNQNLYIDKTINIGTIIENNQISNNTELEVIKYKDIMLSVIGIKSNANITCDINTSSIILCSTICKPKYIKSSTKALNLKTDKSIQHLKQILRCDFIDAYNETIKLISTFAQGTIGKSYEYHNLLDRSKSILIKKKNIHNILGPIQNSENKSLSVEKILKILNKLNFKPIYNNIKHIFQVSIPIYRSHDIKRPIDVIEEIGRIYGFEQFSDAIPSQKKTGKISYQAKIIRKTRQILRDLGIHETLHYSLKHGSKINNEYNISLFNPLIEDQSILQDSLIINLIEAQQYNINQKNFNIEAFEIGRIFKPNIKLNTSSLNNNEEIHLACLMGKSDFTRQYWSDKPTELSWFQAKGILEEFFEKLQAIVEWKSIDNSNISINSKKLTHLLHPQRTAIIYNPKTKEEIGFFGQLNDKQNYYPVYIFEIRLSCLIQTINSTGHLNYRIKTYSIYPSVTRDVSIELKHNEQLDVIYEKILKQANSLLESVEIFNEYKHEKISQPFKRNIGCRLTYRAKDRTLHDIDLERIDKDINYLLQINK